MRWNELQTCEFVKLYLNYEQLWNPEHFDYNLRWKRSKAYKEIISEFYKKTNIEFTDEREVKFKIKILRSTYLQEIVKIRKKARSGYRYRPAMRWFYDFHEMFRKIKKNPEEDVVDDLEIDEQDQDLEQLEEKIWFKPPDSEENSMDNFIDDNTMQDENYTQTKTQRLHTDESCVSVDPHYLLLLHTEHEDKTVESPRPYKMKRKRFKCNTNFSVDQSGNTSRNIYPKLEGKEDEFDIYGKYIASQLRSMQLQRALRVKLEIHSLVSEARIAELDKPKSSLY